MQRRVKVAHAIHVTIAAGRLEMNESPLRITKLQTNVVHASIKAPDKIILIQCSKNPAREIIAQRACRRMANKTGAAISISHTLGSGAAAPAEGAEPEPVAINPKLARHVS